MLKSQRPRVVAVAVSSILAITGCSGTSATPSPTAAPPVATPTSAPASVTPTATPMSLAGVCPDPIVFQSDWEPEAEHGAIYQLYGQPVSIDTTKMSSTAPLVYHGQSTGVNIEVRIGGASIGYQYTESLLQSDPSIVMGWGGFSDMVSNEPKAPMTAVVNIMQTSPRAIYWDPATYPNVTSIADLKTAGPNGTPVVVNMGQSGLEQNFLVDNGILLQSQIDQGNVGKPGKFVAAGGKMAEVGFITAEPYMYQYEISQWGKPLKGQLLDAVGYHEYFMPVFVRTSDLTKYSACLKLLVPMIQQAQVDFIASPVATNAVITNLVKTYNDGWSYSDGMAAWSAKLQKELGIIANGSDGVIGSFDDNRVLQLTAYAEKVLKLDPSKIKISDLYTNQFIDKSIKLP